MPDWKQTIRVHLAPLGLEPEREMEIAEELAQHLEAVYEEALNGGAAEPEAEARALGLIADGRLLESELGRVERPLRHAYQPPAAATEYLERRGGIRMESLLQDLRYGARMLMKRPGFTLIAVLMLALGIGASTAMFSLIHTLLIEPLPYRDADRVLFVAGWNLRRNQLVLNVSAADFRDWRAESGVFEQVAGYRYWNANITGGSTPERVQGYRVTANLFTLLGIEPMLGRTFLPEEDKPGAQRVAVLSHRLWQRRFGADRGVIGKTLTLNDESYAVVGVMPPKFEFPQLNLIGDLWAPFDYDEARLRIDSSANFGMVAVARLRKDRTLGQAQAEMDAVYRRLEQRYPETNAGSGVRLMPMQEMMADFYKIRPALLAL